MATSHNGGVVNFGTLLVPILRAKFLLTGFVIVGVCVGVAHFFLASSEYEAKLVILPEIDSGSTMLSGASDLAMMAGIRLGGSSEPTLYFKDIILSDLILDRVLHASFGDDDQPLFSELGYEAGLADKEKGIRGLRKMTSVSRNNRTGIVTIRVQSHNPSLSSFIADQMAAELNLFLLRAQSQSAEHQFDFLSQELLSADLQLDSAEKDLAKFKRHNRMTLESPELQRELSRLNREVTIREAVLLELRKQAEIMKISINEQVPKVQVIESARAYQNPVYPILFQSLFVGILLFGFLALLVIYSRAYLLPSVSRQISDVQ